MAMPISEPDTSAPTSLQDHYRQCSFASGFVHRLRCAAEDVGGFIAPRIVSVLVVIALVVVGIVSLHTGAS